MRNRKRGDHEFTLAKKNIPSVIFGFLVLIALVACTDSPTEPPDPPRPATLEITPGPVTLTFLGQTASFAATIKDQYGAAFGGTVSWSSDQPEVFTVEASGVVTAAANGSGSLTATFQDLSATVKVAVAQIPTSIEIASGQGQRADQGGSTLPEPVVVRVADVGGSPVKGAAVTFTVAEGAGSVDPTTAVSDSAGLAQTAWTLGDEAGAQTLTANVNDIVVRIGAIAIASRDRAALEALYKATSGLKWTNNDNWLTDAPLGAWYGVSTDEDGKVVRLKMSNNGLTETIPPEIGNLTRLKSLGLADNELTGTIPPEIGNLANLEDLFLDGNGLTGAIPAEIGKLTNLEELELEGNGLTGAIPAEIGNLASLKHLYLYGNKLTGIPPEIGNLASLKHLGLGYNKLTGIPPEIGKLTNLESLHLGDNKLTGIPPEIGNLASLKHLWLGDNKLTGIPGEIGNLTNLEGLSLQGNKLTGIPSEIGNLASLKHLWLGGNKLTGIPLEIGKLTNLEGLHLYGNKLTGIPPEIGNLASLKHLYLYGNKLVGIPPEIGNLANLNYLDLRNNQLTGTIPAEIGNLANLNYLDLRNNQLTGTIPADYLPLDLDFFYWSTNEGLCVPGTSTFLEWTANIKTTHGPHCHEADAAVLKIFFDASDGSSWKSSSGWLRNGPLNDWYGVTTDSIGLVAELDLGGNGLVGVLPSELGSLAHLTKLRIGSNALVGRLPLSLANLILSEFDYADTGLCVPGDTALLEWLRTIPSHIGTDAQCGEEGGTAVYLTQAVQSAGFPVPLVAGEPALLRVFVTAEDAGSARIPPVRATFYRDGREHVADIPVGTFPITAEADESDLRASANAEIPGWVIGPGAAMVVEIDPEGTLDPALGIPERIPETGRMALDVQAMPLLDLTLVPFLWQDNPDSSVVEATDKLSTDNDLFFETRTLLPVGDFKLTIREPLWTSVDPVWANGSKLLREVAAVRVLDGATGHYMGVLRGGGGVARLNGRISLSGLQGRIIAHELGHNMNLLHAPCGGPDFLDNGYPYPDGTIGAWGYDFRDGSLVSSGTPDLMSYCSPEWVSDYHFTNALRFRLLDETRTAARIVLAPTPVLLLWGGADADGDPFLEPAFVANAPPSLPARSGAYQIRGVSTEGRVLFSLDFDMHETADGDGESSFAFALPARPEWASDLASITLTGPGGSATLDGKSDRTAALVRNTVTGRVRGIFRDWSTTAAQAGSGLAAMLREPNLEIQVSRGIPAAASWRR